MTNTSVDNKEEGNKRVWSLYNASLVRRIDVLLDIFSLPKVSDLSPERARGDIIASPLGVAFIRRVSISSGGRRALFGYLRGQTCPLNFYQPKPRIGFTELTPGVDHLLETCDV